jgi:transposase
MNGTSNHRGLPHLNQVNQAHSSYYGGHASWAADLAARVWTITTTAERNHREPLAYLTEYLQACATAGGKAPQSQVLQRFLPWLLNPGDGTVRSLTSWPATGWPTGG